MAYMVKNKYTTILLKEGLKKVANSTNLGGRGGTLGFDVTLNS